MRVPQPSNRHETGLPQVICRNLQERSQLPHEFVESRRPPAYGPGPPAGPAERSPAKTAWRMTAATASEPVMQAAPGTWRMSARVATASAHATALQNASIRPSLRYKPARRIVAA